MKRIKNILEMLPIRSSDIINDIQHFPPLYRQFLNTYSVCRNCIKSELLYLHRYAEYVELGVYAYEKIYEINIFDFFSSEESDSCLMNAYDGGGDILTMGYRPIAMCAFNRFLFVGIKAENLDQIFLENSSLFSDGERIKFIAPNIFELLKYIWLTEDEHIGYGINSYSQLYKNWGEDFWRIRPNETDTAAG